MSCSYCGEPGATREMVGQCVVFVCDDSLCIREFDDDCRDADREAALSAREDAEADD